MDLGVKIGHDQKSVTEVGKLIRYIIDAPTGECVKLAALKAMEQTLSINNTSFSYCDIGDSINNHYVEQGEEGEAND